MNTSPRRGKTLIPPGAGKEIPAGRPLRDAAVLVLACLLTPSLTLAGRIQIQPDIRVAVSNGIPVAEVRLFNTGDEPALVFSANGALLAPGVTAAPDDRPSCLPDPAAAPAGRTLSPGDSCDFLISLPPPVLPGYHQAVFRIRYADLTGARFSSVKTAGFAFSGPAGGADPATASSLPRLDDGWLSATVDSPDIGRSCQVRVSLCLLQEASARVKVRLVLPDEFECQAPEQDVDLDPDNSRDVVFEIINRGGIPGSSYSVTAVAVAESSGMVRSTSAAGAVTVAAGDWLGQSPWFWFWLSVLALSGLLVMAGVTGRRRFRRIPVVAELVTRRTPRWYPAWFDACVLVVLSGFILWTLAPADLLRNTTTVGGDTPAHLYLVSHLREQLFQHGRLVSWAGGWWAGFPMFQFYFVLPYLAAALLSLLIPLNVAFKLMTVAGLVATPLCAWWAARLWRLPPPVPVVMAVAMVPFLFVGTHVMWGVNTASTLAGMIANSWSFALMLPAVASVCRDAGEGRVRVRTILLMVLVLASHFFTSVIMFLTLAIVPVLCRRRSALGVVFVEALVAVLLMAWWLVPLMGKSCHSMDFGVNWAVRLLASFPAYAAGLLVFALVAVIQTLVRPMRAVWILLWMLALAVFLYAFGFALSPVFVNIRLWPFIFFALMALAATGLGVLIGQVRRQALWVAVLSLAVLLGVTAGDSRTGRLTGPGLTRSWAKWNYSGLETKPAAAVFEELVKPLRGTPGRLANDLCEENNQIGSSRIFELAPHLAGKPILEGGLVNSALGSMYAYAIQGEISTACAGFPPIVTPQAFNVTNATRHLELFNVKHFIARSGLARRALRDNPAWRFIDRVQEWELYELTTHEGRMVFIPPRQPLVMATGTWKEDSLQWLYVPRALGQFVAWYAPGLGPERRPDYSRDQFLGLLQLWQAGSTNGMAPELQEAGTRCISGEEVADDHIRFRTTAIGLPHIIKMSWYPNWKAKGADAVYCVSPGFMLVYPRQEQVELYYGTTWSDRVGYALTLLGAGMMAGVMVRSGIRRRNT